MLEPLLMNTGNLFRVATRHDFAHQLLGQEGTEPSANGLLARHAEKLFHAGVPGFDNAVQVHRQYADVQRFNDVFAEILETGDLQRFLLEGTVKLRVVQRHRHVAGDRFHQFDVIAGEEVPVNRLTEAQNGDGVFADAAGDEIIQIELLERAADGLADVTRRTGRLKKERPAGELGPGRLEKTKVQGFEEPHTHGTRDAHLAGLQRIFHKNRKPIDEQRLGDAVHDRAEHGIEAYFIRQGAPEFNQRAAIVEAVAVEKAVEAPLNSFAERLEQKGCDNNGDHAANRARRLRVEDIGNEGHERKINRGDGRRGRGVGQASLEDDIHVHQAVADDGIAETQGNQHEAQHRHLHPRVRVQVDIEHQRKDVKQRNRQTADESAARQPL